MVEKREDGYDYREGDLYQNRIVLYPHGSGVYMNLHNGVNNTTLHIQCTNVSFLVLMLCYNYIRCNPWEKLEEGTDLFVLSLQLPVNLYFTRHL